MRFPENNDLEMFIHAQLQKLPEHEAPEGLTGKVLAAIATRRKLPWWKQSFTHWPRPVRNLLFLALGLIFAGAVYGSGRAAGSVAMPEVLAPLSWAGWAGQVMQGLGEAIFLAMSSLPMEGFIGIGVVFVILYGACLAAGFALFRVTSSSGSSSFELGSGSFTPGSQGA